MPRSTKRQKTGAPAKAAPAPAKAAPAPAKDAPAAAADAPAPAENLELERAATALAATALAATVVDLTAANDTAKASLAACNTQGVGPSSPAGLTYLADCDYADIAFDAAKAAFKVYTTAFKVYTTAFFSQAAHLPAQVTRAYDTTAVKVYTTAFLSQAAHLTRANDTHKSMIDDYTAAVTATGANSQTCRLWFTAANTERKVTRAAADAPSPAAADAPSGAAADADA